jgi:hypothetical protein
MRIYYPRKTQGGMCCAMYGKGRSVHCMKRGGYVPLLLSPGLGDGNVGSGLPSMKKVEQTKPRMNAVIEKLGRLQMEAPKKRKNISFQF